MSIDEIRKNAPSWANAYKIQGDYVEYVFVPIVCNLGLDSIYGYKDRMEQFDLAGAIPL